MSDKRDEQLKSLSTRLGDAIRAAGGLTAVAKMTGIPHRSLSRYVNEGVEPSATTLGTIARAIGVRIDSLFYGEDVIAKDSSDQKKTSINTDLEDDVVLIPMLDVVASAGTGVVNGHPEVIAKLPFSRSLLRRLGISPDRVEFIHASGDSMMPTITDGSPVLVDRSKKDIRGDAIYVVSLGEQVRIKRVHQGIDGVVTLISDNEKHYPPEKLSRADAEQLRIHGRVFWTEKLL